MKVIQLPRPTSGTASPLDGMARLATRGCCARPRVGPIRGAAAMAPSNLRRVIFGKVSNQDSFSEVFMTSS